MIVGHSRSISDSGAVSKPSRPALVADRPMLGLDGTVLTPKAKNTPFGGSRAGNPAANRPMLAPDGTVLLPKGSPRVAKPWAGASGSSTPVMDRPILALDGTVLSPKSSSPPSNSSSRRKYGRERVDFSLSSLCVFRYHHAFSLTVCCKQLLVF